MKYAKTLKAATAGVIISSGLLLTACGSDGDSSTSGGSTPASTSSTVGGVAATGAPLAGGSIVLHCQNSWNEGTTADSNGAWSIAVPSANLPCAVKATPAGGGQSLYAFTLGSGSNVVTNVTPLTSLALAKTGTAPDDTWFNALNDAGRQALASNLTAAITALKTALENGGYTLPTGFNPFNVTFTASAGNSYDDLLEAIKAALDDASSDLATLLASVASGGSLPEAVDSSSGGNAVSEALTATGAGSALLDILQNLAGEYHLKVTDVYSEGASAGADTVFPLNSVLTVTIGAGSPPIAIVTPVRTLKYDTNPTFMRQGSGASEKIIINLQGQFSSMGTVSLEYMPATGHLVLNTAGFKNNEGLATLESKKRESSNIPALADNEFGVRFNTTGLVGMIGTTTGTQENSVARFYATDAFLGSDGTRFNSIASFPTGGVSNGKFSLASASGQAFPTTPGTYACGNGAGAISLQINYSASAQYYSTSDAGFDCSLTITHSTAAGQSTITGRVEGTFTAKLARFGVTPATLASGVQVQGRFRIGQ